MTSATADTAVPSQTAADRGERRVNLFKLCLLTLGVGIMTGVGAVALRSLVERSKPLVGMFRAAGALAVLANVAPVAEDPPRRVDEPSPFPKPCPRVSSISCQGVRSRAI
jgi:hypothetical protein